MYVTSKAKLNFISIFRNLFKKNTDMPRTHFSTLYEINSNITFMFI